MATLKDIVGYFCSEYPYKNELSNARLTKMVYLADWRSALQKGEQISPIRWQFHHYGPYVEDVLRTVTQNPEFRVSHTKNYYDQPKALIDLKAKIFETETLTDTDKELLDFVIEKTRSINWNEFMKLVYSTYPVATQQRYETLDLPKLAAESRRLHSLFEDKK